MAFLFPDHALPPAVRARVALLRDRAAGPDGLVTTCGGVSMEPAIRRGDPVTVRARAPRAGAVAAFVTTRGELELHRLVAAAPGGWWAHLGDNQIDPSPGLVHATQVIGLAEVAARAPGVRARARALVRLARAAARVAARAARQPGARPHR